MKKILLLFTLSLLFSCNNSKKSTQNNNKEVNENEYVDLLGVFNKKELNKEPYDFWFKENYTNYELDYDIADKIKPLIKDGLPPTTRPKIFWMVGLAIKLAICWVLRPNS